MAMAETLFQELSALPQVEAVALGGSRAGTEYDERSDYDVYLYCTAPIGEDVRAALLSRYCVTSWRSATTSGSTRTTAP